jgi:hypothetical protein
VQIHTVVICSLRSQKHLNNVFFVKRVVAVLEFREDVVWREQLAIVLHQNGTESCATSIYYLILRTIFAQKLDIYICVIIAHPRHGLLFGWCRSVVEHKIRHVGNF